MLASAQFTALSVDAVNKPHRFGVGITDYILLMILF